MARPRHAKPSGLLARLFPGRAARRRSAVLRDVLLRQVADELRHVRAVADQHAAAAADADWRAQVAERAAEAARAATADLRAEVARLREELLWAWAEGRLPTAAVTPPARVVDLRGAVGS
jgi:hypothetical protein